ncbi:MAG: hypothetical protein LBR10_13365 [Prevotellaceae bacterium]|jgi:hypothetical protein|nr:hypothetical protein [Prevotellaceae bacterium]
MKKLNVKWRPKTTQKNMGQDLQSRKSRGNKKTYMKYCILLILFIGFYSCNSRREFTREDLIGTWDVRYNYDPGDEIILKYCGERSIGCEAITFDYDGTFVQHLARDQYGKWQVEGSGENKYLVLIYNNNVRLKTEFRWFTVVKEEYKTGNLILLINNAGKEEEMHIPIYTN